MKTPCHRGCYKNTYRAGGPCRPRPTQGRDVYYESALNKIAIEPAEPRMSGLVPLIAKNFGAYCVPAAQFVRQNRLHIASIKDLRKPEIIHNSVRILDLNETVRVSRGRKTSYGWRSDSQISMLPKVDAHRLWDHFVLNFHTSTLSFAGVRRRRDFLSKRRTRDRARGGRSFGQTRTRR